MRISNSEEYLSFLWSKNVHIEYIFRIEAQNLLQ